VSLERIAPIARRQHGLVTTTQVLEQANAGQLDWLLRTGNLEPVRRGVYRTAGAPESWLQHLLAACLARPGSYASFRAAAALWRLEGFDADLLEITVPGTSRARLDGVVVHESRVVGPAHTAIRNGIPVSSAARTLCDLTAVVPVRRKWLVERAVDEALRRKLVTVRRLGAVADDLAGRGRMRCTVMREILEHRTPGYDPGESEPERRIVDVLLRAGLPEPVRQHPVTLGGRRYRIDLCYPEHKIAIEYDGWEHHRGRRAFDADRARGNDLVILGYQLLRFTSKSSDQTIAETVAAALARATGSTPPHSTDY
jgi:very-short-patch-repair endonuclease